MNKTHLLVSGASVLLSAGLYAAPAKPVLAWMPSSFTDGNNISVNWDMWWGENGASWALNAGSSAVCDGSLTMNSPQAQGASCTTNLPAGTHDLVVSLCNDNGCTLSDAKTIMVANDGDTGGGDDGGDNGDNGGGDNGGDTGGGDTGDGDTGGGDTGEAGTPASPTVAWLGDQTLSGGTASFTVGWNMWWGENGTSWTLRQNGNEIHSASLSSASPSAQSGSHIVTVDAAGTYSYVVSLCNGDVCTDSNASVVNVTSGGSSGGGNPDEPGDFDPWTDLDMTGWPHPLKENNRPYNLTSGKQVGAYFVEWGIYGRNYHVDDIPAQNLTHLYYGFIPVCGPNQGLRDANPEGYAALNSQCSGKQDYEVVVHDAFAALEKSYPGDVWSQPIRGIFGQLYRLKQAHPDLIILPSVGGWTLSDPLYDIGTDAAARAVFIDYIIDFIRTYDFFDGIDIDWEFPGGGGSTPGLGSPEDDPGYVTLMRELRAALDALSNETGRTYELASAMSGGVEKLSAIGDGWAEAVSYMDHLNLMTYDYYGAWNGVLGHQTGLYPAQNAAIPGFSAHEAVQYILSKNVPPEKISLGVAMYGRGWKDVSGANPGDPFSGNGGQGIDGTWERGIMDYKNIEADIMGGPNGSGVNGFEVRWDDIAKASYAWNPSTRELIGFDTQRSVMEKGHYVLQNNLGGLFAWEIDADNGHILNSMNEGLGHSEE